MPDWRSEVRARLASVRLDPHAEAEIVEEIADHLDDEFAALAPRIGAEAAAAQLRAQLNDPAFANSIIGARRVRRTPSIEDRGAGSLWQDVRFSARSLGRRPGMALAGALALALGIGLTVTMYGVIYGTLLRGLPYDGAERIAMVFHADPSREWDEVPLGDFQVLARRQQSFERFGAFAPANAIVAGGDRPDRVSGARMSPGAFDVTGVPPRLGRTFGEADVQPGAPPTVVLGFAVWRDRFASDSTVLGRVVRVNGRPHSVIGVMPERFEFPHGARVWLPMQLDPAVRPGEGVGVILVGRLRARTGFEQANTELAVHSANLSRERIGGSEVRLVAQPFVRAIVPGQVYALMYAMFGAVVLVLLVACANVAHLLLDRAIARSRELGIRSALGASRLALVRLPLIEAVMIAGLGAIAGTALAFAGLAAFARALIEGPFWMDLRMHPAVLLSVVVLALVAGVVSGLAPAVQLARMDASGLLKDESHAASSRRAGRISRGLVVAQIATSSALLLAAGFITKGIVNQLTLDPGFRVSDVYTARVSLTAGDTARQRRFFEAADQRLAAIPGITASYVGSRLPGGWRGDRVAVDGRTYERERDQPFIWRLAASPGFFETFDVPILHGRAIDARDAHGAPGVAVVSESFVRRIFPEGDAIGRRIRFGGPDTADDWVTIVGVMPSLMASTVEDPWAPTAVTSVWQERRLGSASIAVRGSPGAANAAAIRQVVSALDPDAAVDAESSMAGVLAQAFWTFRVFGTTFVAFGFCALVLAAIGLYAVMQFSVSRRLREMGIRMALGATPGDMVQMVCRHGAVQLLLGSAIGLPAGLGVVRVARAVLFDVRADDPIVVGAVLTVLGGAAVIACLVPALRATRVDTLTVLRSE